MNIKAKDLIKSSVLFNEDEHKYMTLAEDFTPTYYNGVTAIIGSVLFPDKYGAVAPEVLQRAAERGTRIHQLCQATDTIPTEAQEDDDRYATEVANYKALKESNEIEMIANEYLVSNDEWQVASMIDCVDSQGNLYDIKTTYSLDKEWVSWQLSMYAEMYERQNPTLKVGNLYAIWLRGENAEIVQVSRKTLEQIESVINAYRRGVTLTSTDNDEVAGLVSIEEQIAEVKEQLKVLEEHRLLMLTPIVARMGIDGLKSLESDRIKITVVADTVTSKFDSTLLKKENPELYAKYSKEATRKGYVKTTLI